MIGAYTRTLKSYMVFDGRTKRSEFGQFVLTQSAITAGALILSSSVNYAVGLLLALYLLGTFAPALAATVRRLHDTGRSAWWLLLGVGLASVSIGLLLGGILFIQIGLTGEIFLLFTELVEGGTDVEAFGGLFEFGLALFALGAMATVVSGMLAIVLLVFLASPSQKEENKYGPQLD